MPTTLDTKMVAVVRRNRFGQPYYSLRFAREDGEAGAFEWASLHWERDQWTAWDSDEDFGKFLRSKLHDVRRAPLRTVLLVLKAALVEWENPKPREDDQPFPFEPEYEAWVLSMGDPSGPAQYHDANFHG